MYSIADQEPKMWLTTLILSLGQINLISDLIANFHWRKTARSHQRRDLFHVLNSSDITWQFEKYAIRASLYSLIHLNRPNEVFYMPDLWGSLSGTSWQSFNLTADGWLGWFSLSPARAVTVSDESKVNDLVMNLKAFYRLTHTFARWQSRLSFSA